MMEDSIRKELAGKIQYRTFAFDRSKINVEERTIEIALSSEEPVERYWGVEILDHSPGSVEMDRLSNGAPVLWMHEWDEHLGTVLNARVDPDKVCRATVKMSRSDDGEEKWNDIQDGILTKVSVGYMYGEDAILPEVDPETMKQAKTEEGLPIYRIRGWMPYEVSFVTVPADDTVGVGRTMEKNQHAAEGPKQTTITKRGEYTMDESKVPPQASEEMTRQAETERVAAIEAIAKKFAGRVSVDMEAMKKDAIDLQVPVDLFRGAVFTKVNDGRTIELPETAIGMSDRQVKEFSLTRLIKSYIPEMNTDASFERECSKAVAKSLGIEPKGAFIPWEVQNRQVQAKRIQTVGTVGDGGYTVGTTLLASSFIEMLRNAQLAGPLGVTRLDGLVGNVDIPKQSGAGGFGFVAENNAGTAGTLAFLKVTLAPKEGRGYVDFTRKLLLQGTPAIEGLVTSDLATVAAIGMDAQIFHGAGTNAPSGLAITAGVGSVDGTAYSWQTALSNFSALAVANAANGAMKFALNPAVYAVLMGRAKETGFPVYILENGKIGPWDALYSNQINANCAFFGNWSQVILATWGAIDILVDPYTASSTGSIRVNVYATMDVGVRYPTAFTYTSNFS
jgi:HK97 family phage major capsid protein